MLVLSRKEGERIKLGNEIVLTIVRVSGDKVRVGIKAPSDMIVLREELDDEPAATPDKDAATGDTRNKAPKKGKNRKAG